MIIQVNQDYRLHKIDELSWAIEKKLVIGKATNNEGRQANPENIGKERWKATHYYADLSQACVRLAKVLSDTSEATTLSAYSSKLLEVGEHIARIVQKSIGVPK